MASKKREPGRDQPGSAPARIVTYGVRNIAHQPREFKLSGKWYRWEPRGHSGDTISLPEIIVENADFKRIERYFTKNKE